MDTDPVRCTRMGTFSLSMIQVLRSPAPAPSKSWIKKPKRCHGSDAPPKKRSTFDNQPTFNLKWRNPNPSKPQNALSLPIPTPPWPPPLPSAPPPHLLRHPDFHHQYTSQGTRKTGFSTSVLHRMGTIFLDCGVLLMPLQPTNNQKRPINIGLQRAAKMVPVASGAWNTMRNKNKYQSATCCRAAPTPSV